MKREGAFRDVRLRLALHRAHEEWRTKGRAPREGHQSDRIDLGVPAAPTTVPDSAKRAAHPAARPKFYVVSN